MEIVCRDQVIARGTNSLGVKLPSMLVKLLGIKKGAKVNYGLENGRLVLEFEKIDGADGGEAGTF